MKIPGSFFAGDSVSWIDNQGADNLGSPITSSDWSLKYDFRQTGVDNLTVTGSASNTGWNVSLTPTQTAAYSAGPLYWQAYATKGSDRITLGSGFVTVQKNFVASENTDEFRTQSQQDLDSVRAAIRAIITGGAVSEYSIGGRMLKKLPMADLIQLESILKARVVRENKAASIANGLGNPSNVYVRFK